MLDATHVSGGPHFSADLFAPNGKLARLHKGGGSAASIRESKLGREQSAKQFREQMDLMKRQNSAAEMQQAQALEAAKRPVNEPAPTATTADGMDAASAARRASSKRKGLKYSLFATPKAETTGAPTLLG